MTDTHLLLVAALLTWASLLLASVLRSRSWTPDGAKLAFGNRDAMPEPSPLAGRAERAARNTVDNVLLFVAAFAAARLSGAPPERLMLGAHAFVWARCVYLAVYLAGIPYLRTAVYAVSVMGIAWVGSAAL